MGLLLGDTAPDFSAVTTMGTIRFHDWIGKSWCMLFSHPADFTPVCTTELSALARLQPEFTRRQVKLIGLSIDPVFSHHEWISDIEKKLRVVIDYPIIADEDRRIADLYGMLYGLAVRSTCANATVRSVFVIDPAKMIRLVHSYPESTGRSFSEILRAIDSLQLAEEHELATPADWVTGEDCLIPLSVQEHELQSRFSDGWMEVTSYLRYAPYPRPRPVLDRDHP
jgi:alkyl hydroperoxide reductase subunit AhpC